MHHSTHQFALNTNTQDKSRLNELTMISNTSAPVPSAYSRRPESSYAKSTYSTASRNTTRSAVSRNSRSRTRRAFENFLQRRAVKKTKKAIVKLLGIKSIGDAKRLLNLSNKQQFSHVTAAPDPNPSGTFPAPNGPEIRLSMPSVNGKRTTLRIHEAPSVTHPAANFAIRNSVRMAHPAVSGIIAALPTPASTATWTSLATSFSMSSAMHSPVGLHEFPDQVNPVQLVSKVEGKSKAQALNQVDGIKSKRSRHLTVDFIDPACAPTLKPLACPSSISPEPFERPAEEYVSRHDQREHQRKILEAFAAGSTEADAEDHVLSAREAAAAALEGGSSPHPLRKESLPAHLQRFADQSNSPHPQPANLTSAPAKQYHSSRRYTAYTPLDALNATVTGKGKAAAAAHVQQNIEAAQQASTPAHAAPALIAGPDSDAEKTQGNSRYTAFDPLSNVPAPQPRDAINMLSSRQPPADARTSKRWKRLTMRHDNADFDVQSTESSVTPSPYRLSQESAYSAQATDAISLPSSRLPPSDARTNDRHKRCSRRWDNADFDVKSIASSVSSTHLSQAHAISGPAQDAISVVSSRIFPPDAHASDRHKRYSRRWDNADFDVQSTASSTRSTPRRLNHQSAVPEPLRTATTVSSEWGTLTSDEGLEGERTPIASSVNSKDCERERDPLSRSIYSVVEAEEGEESSVPAHGPPAARVTMSFMNPRPAPRPIRHPTLLGIRRPAIPPPISIPPPTTTAELVPSTVSVFEPAPAQASNPQQQQQSLPRQPPPPRAARAHRNMAAAGAAVAMLQLQVKQQNAEIKALRQALEGQAQPFLPQQQLEASSFTRHTNKDKKETLLGKLFNEDTLQKVAKAISKEDYRRQRYG